MSSASSHENSVVRRNPITLSLITRWPVRGRRAGAEDGVAHARDLAPSDATSWTRTRWAPPRTQAATAAAVPKSRSPTGRSSTRPMKLLRDGPDQQRPVERRPARAGGAAPPGVGRVLREAEARDRAMTCAAGDARALRVAQALARARRDLARHVAVGGLPVHGLEVAAQVHEDRGHAAARATSGASAGIEAEAAHVVHEVGAGVERGRAPPRPCVVSMETKPGPRRRSASITGTTRRISSSAATGLAARTRRFAADVHDVRALCELSEARARRRPPDRRKRPPSEKESGVTLSTPMTQVRVAQDAPAAPGGSAVWTVARFGSSRVASRLACGRPRPLADATSPGPPRSDRD